MVVEVILEQLFVRFGYGQTTTISDKLFTISQTKGFIFVCVL